MDASTEGPPRSYTIRKSPHLGFGFVAGHDFPTIVKAVERNGPSFKRLRPGDVIMAVNGTNVSTMNRQQIIDFIQSCQDEIRITVRQPSYEELLRAKNLTDPRFYTLNNNNSNRQPLNPYVSPTQSPLNRLVTSIAQQQQPQSPRLPQKPLPSPTLLYKPICNDDTPPVQIKSNPKPLPKRVPFSVDGSEELANNEKIIHSSTLGRNHKYGKHSPVPLRSKSSMDTNKNGKKVSGDEDDQPMLKRSNTMRPIKPPAKVLEIFEVVIKIFFEVGFTRVLTYNQDTTVGTILETLNARLNSNSPYFEQIKKYFGLALTFGPNPEKGTEEQQPKRKLLHILDENDSIMKIRKLHYAPQLRLLYRMIYPPSDVSNLYVQDKVAFEYLYQQSCNDLKLERFCPDLDLETALKLSALYLLEHVHSNYSKQHGNSKDPKVYIKLVKKSPGLESFVPISIAKSVMDKKGKRNVGQYKKLKLKLSEQLKRNFEEFDFEPPQVKSTTNLNCYSSTSFHELSLPEMQSTPSDFIKLQFLNFLSQLPCYGNSKRSGATDASPVERNSGGDCSSSLESVPRTSDSSPLIRQEKTNQVGLTTSVTNSSNNRPENANLNAISRMAQMNSMRSLNSTAPTPTNFQPVDQTDIAQTPSIESISSITFNMQNSPSPQQAPSLISQPVDDYIKMSKNLEPSPMPRQIHSAKNMDYHTIDKLYSQRYKYNQSSIDEVLKKFVIPPPPTPSNVLYSDTFYKTPTKTFELKHTTRQLTQVLTDEDIDRLRVPPPPPGVFY